MSLIDKLGLTSKKKKEEEIKRNRKQRRGDDKMNQRGEQIMKKAKDLFQENSLQTLWHILSSRTVTILTVQDRRLE